jgi:hypothetical protein
MQQQAQKTQAVAVVVAFHQVVATQQQVVQELLLLDTKGKQIFKCYNKLYKQGGK